MFTLTTERAEDGPAIEALLNTAFGPSRDSKISYRYRDGVPPVIHLKLVARDAADTIIGTIRYWPILIGPAARAGLLLGPLAVATQHQAKGIGAALVRRTLEMAGWARHKRVLLVGDPAYYTRFGFELVAPLGITMPGENPVRLLGLGLTPDAFEGVSGAIQPWRSVRRRGYGMKAA